MRRTLRRVLNQHWRLHATGFAFATFGLGAVFLGFTWFPLLRLFSWQEATLRRRTRRTLHYAFRAFLTLLRGLGLLTYSLERPEALRTAVPAHGRLVIANHPSLIDVVFLIALMPEADCIVKAALWQNPFLRWPVVWAGYIPNHEGEALVQHAAARLRQGGQLILFPEGTRSQSKAPLQFKRGAMQIALASGCEVLPVVIRCQPSTLTKAEKWWQIPPQRPHWHLAVHPAWPPFSPQATPLSLQVRALSQGWLDWYNRHL